MSLNAVWTLEEEQALLQFLNDHQAEAGDNGNFKKATLERAAAHIASLLKRGPKKTYRTCQNKWAALRKIFRVVTAIKNVSGWTWNDATGASITPELVSTWDAYVARHPDAKPFRNRGWVHLDLVASLMPSPNATSNVFHPTASQSSQDNSDDSTDDEDSSPGVSTNEDRDDLEGDLVSETSASSRPPLSRKRSTNSSTPARAPKRVRMSAGASALQDVAASVARFGESMAAALAPPTSTLPTTPRRRLDAITAARKLEQGWLTSPQLVLLIDVFHKDKSACETYSSISDNEELRREWVALQINIPGPIHII